MAEGAEVCSTATARSSPCTDNRNSIQAAASGEMSSRTNTAVEIIEANLRGLCLRVVTEMEAGWSPRINMSKGKAPVLTS